MYHFVQESTAGQSSAGQTSTGQPTTGQPAADGGFNLFQFFPIALIIIVFYFLIIRPQQKNQREKDSVLKSLKKNDHVVTSGGITGIVVNVKDADVTLLIDEKHDVKVRVMRSAIVAVEKSSPASEDKTASAKEEAKK